MRVVAWHFAVSAGAFAWVAVAACVGDDPDPSSSTPTPAEDARAPAPGEFQGPCNAAGGCIEGLVCKDGLCLHGDDVADAGDAAVVDAGPDTTRPPDDCPVSNVEAGATQNPCPTSLSSSSSSSGGQEEKPCAKGTACCVAAPSGQNYCAAAVDCVSNTGKAYGCSGTATCGTGELCCLEMEDAGANPKVTDSCPRTISKVGFKSAHCTPTACGSTETRICRDSTECALTEQCRRITFTTGDGVITLGVCL